MHNFIDVSDAEGKTPLAFAAHLNFVAGVKFLLSKGANPNICDANGVSPLHWAALRVCVPSLFSRFGEGLLQRTLF